jgi:hypothetical protein
LREIAGTGQKVIDRLRRRRPSSLTASDNPPFRTNSGFAGNSGDNLDLKIKAAEPIDRI